MTALKNLTSYQPLPSFCRTFLSNRHRLTHINVLSTEILTQNPNVRKS